jgi:hypothetical protein
MKRLALLLAAVCTMMALSGGTALAAPVIAAHGTTNPIAWGLKSMQWGSVWVQSDDATAYAEVKVLSSKGVVATLYRGALGARPANAAGKRMFPAWNGKGADGKYLPTGVYNYRITLSSGGQVAVATGQFGVSRLRFTIEGNGTLDQPSTYSRYLYAGRTYTYHRVYLPAEGRFAGVFWCYAPNATADLFTQGWIYTVQASDNPPVWAGTNADTFITPKAGQYYWDLCAGDENLTVSNGAKIQLTVVQ